MGNGHFGAYFVGSDANGRQTVSNSRRTIPRDYERTLYKTGRFPFNPDSKSTTPWDTPTSSTKAIPVGGATPSYGKLTATRPVSTMTHVQRYDNCGSLKQNCPIDQTNVCPGTRNFGRSYNRLFRHHDDFQLNYKECYDTNQNRYHQHCSKYPYQSSNYFRDSFELEPLECCSENPCRKYLTANSRYPKGADDCTTNTDFGHSSTGGKVSAVTSIASSVGGSYRIKGCQTDPSPWILYENNHNWKLMVVKPNRMGQTATPPISISPNVARPIDARTPFNNDNPEYRSTQEVQTDPGYYVQPYNPAFNNTVGLGQGYPQGSFNVNRNDPSGNRNGPGADRNDQRVNRKDPSLNRYGPGADRNDPSLNRYGPGVVENDPSMNRNGPGADRNDPSLNRNGQGMDRNDPTGNRNGPGADRNEPSLNRNDPSLNRNGQGVDRNDPTRNRNGHGADRNEPGLNRNDLSVNRNDPSLNRNGQGLDRNDPSLNRNGQGVDRNDPSLNRNGQGVDRNDPSLNRSGPDVDRNDPSLNRNDPSLNRYGPGVVGNDPSMNRNGAGDDRNDPSRYRNGVGVDRNDPSLNGYGPGVDGNDPSMNRNDPTANELNPYNINNEPMGNSGNLKPNTKNIRTANKLDGGPKRKTSKVVTQQPSTQLRNSENDIGKRKKSVPKSKKSISDNKPERNPSRLNGGIPTTGITSNPPKLNNTGSPGKTTKQPNAAQPPLNTKPLTETQIQLPNGVTKSPSPLLEKSPFDPEIPSLTPSLQLLQKPSSTKGSQTDPKNPNKSETNLPSSQPNKVIVTSKTPSTPQDNPKGKNQEPIKPASIPLVPAPDGFKPLDPFPLKDSRENLPRRKEPHTTPSATPTIPTPNASTPSLKLKRRIGRHYNPQDLPSVKPIYTSKTISTSGSDDGQPYFVPSRPSRFRRRKSADFNTKPKSSSDTSVPQNSRKYPPAPVPPSVTSGSSSSPERLSSKNIPNGVKKADSYNGPIQSSSPTRRPLAANPAGVPETKPSNSKLQSPITGSNNSTPSGLVRYPSRNSAPDGRIYMARKHSVNQLKESLSRQGPQGKIPSPGPHPPLIEKRGSLGKVPLTIPSTLSLTKLRQGEVKLVTRTEAKQELENETRLRDSGLIVLPANKGRSRLVSVLKKPSITKSSKSSSSQNLQKKRSVRFHGVPPTPPSP